MLRKRTYKMGDRRVIKTKKAIIKALSELIEEKGFNNITIKDLTEKADINRGTFYLHYEDKYDMLKSIEKDIFEDILKIFTFHNELGDVERLFLNDPNPIVMDVLKYVEENSKIFKSLLGPKGDPNFSSNLKDYIGKIVGREEIFQKLSEKSELPMEYIVAYFTSADIGVIQFWVESDMKLPVDKVALLLTKMLTLGYVTFAKSEKKANKN